METNKGTLEDNANKPEFKNGDIVRLMLRDGNYELFISRGPVTDKGEEWYRKRFLYNMLRGRIRLDSIFDPYAGYNLPRYYEDCEPNYDEFREGDRAQQIANAERKLAATFSVGVGDTSVRAELLQHATLKEHLKLWRCNFELTLFRMSNGGYVNYKGDYTPGAHRHQFLRETQEKVQERYLELEKECYDMNCEIEDTLSSQDKMPVPADEIKRKIERAAMLRWKLDLDGKLLLLLPCYINRQYDRMFETMERRIDHDIAEVCGYINLVASGLSARIGELEWTPDMRRTEWYRSCQESAPIDSDYRKEHMPPTGMRNDGFSAGFGKIGGGD